MQFGKTLVGGIIGGALGVGLLVAAYLLFSIDKMWMAIPVAALTGLGVRMAAAKNGRASYLRGAITVLLAVGAYMGGLAITKSVANHRTIVAKAPHPAGAEAGDAGDEKNEGPAAPAAPVDVQPTVTTHPELTPRRVPLQTNTRDMIWDGLSLALAALVAYELGRGAGAAPTSMDTVAVEPASVGTHPDA